MKSKNPILVIVLVFLSLVISTYSAHAISGTDSISDFNAVKTHINNIQTLDTGLPSGVAEPKGRFGSLISRIFTANWQIGNRFLKALGIRSNNAVLKWSGGYDGELVNSSITDNGSTVGISGNLSVSGRIATSTPTADNHATTKAYVDSAVAGVAVGDNLWNHTATENLKMSGYEIDNIKHLNLKPWTGNGLRFWQSDSYKISMGNAAEYKYGPVQDYSIKSSMNSSADRGWTWGVAGQTPVMALANNGKLQLKSNLIVENGKIGIRETNPTSALHIADNSDISSMNDKSAGLLIWRSGSFLAMDWNEMQAHNGVSATSYAFQPFWGSIGIANFPNTSDTTKLDVNGNIRISWWRTLIFGDQTWNNKQSIYWDGGSAWYFDSSHDTSSRIILRDDDNDVFWGLYWYQGDSIGLTDGDGNWSYRAIKDYRTDFIINNSIKMRILNNGNVGIGLSWNPSEKLDISGNLKVSGNVKANGWITVDDRIAISSTNDSHSAQSTVENHYGYFGVYDNSGDRGAYFWYGNGGSRVEIDLDKASELYIKGGNLNVPGKIITSTPTSSNHVATKWYVDARWSSSVTTYKKELKWAEEKTWNLWSSHFFCALGTVRIFDNGGAFGWPSEWCDLYRSGGNWIIKAYNNHASADITICRVHCFNRLFLPPYTALLSLFHIFSPTRFYSHRAFLVPLSVLRFPHQTACAWDQI